MILLREIQERDLDALERFSQIPGFINLTSDRDVLRELIRRSTASFQGKIASPWEGKYIFVAERHEVSKGARKTEILGTSMVAAQHGTVESPHFYFEVSNEKRFSDTINTGFIHGTLKLKFDTDGPSEVGGLVVDPSVRHGEEHVGRQISFVRFLFAGLHKAKFKRQMIAELLPPLNKRGQSPLWEAIGRRFTNMDYWEADKLCQKNKEFIFSLFPVGKIYTTFLPAEARNAIGKVGKETEPVLHMLQKIGFEYRNQVDPFDGGPHLWAQLEKILPIRKIRAGVYDPKLSGPPESFAEGLITRQEASGAKPGEFRAVAVKALVSEEAGGKIRIGLSEGDSAAAALIGLSQGAQAAFMPYY